MDDLFGNNIRDKMAEYEKVLCERNDDDWFVSDICIDFINEIEYRMYESECDEVYKNAE